MSTLFISDIHLSAQRPDMTAALVRFLEHDAPGADALYVLGDLFEFWIGDDDTNPLHQQMADAFLALSQQNVPIYFIHGNRDFLLGQQFAKRAGMTLLGMLRQTVLAERSGYICLHLEKSLRRSWAMIPF